MMQIRQGEVHDWPFIYALSKAVIPASVSPWRKQVVDETIKFREKALKGFWTWIQQTDSKVFVAEARDEDGDVLLIGYLVLYPSSREELTGVLQGWVMDVAVLPTFRRQGVGRALFAAAEDYCRETGLAYLGLAVSSHNVQALKLYESLGFAEERKLMVKVLD